MVCVAATGTATGTSRWSSGQKQMQGKRQMPIILHVEVVPGSWEHREAWARPAGRCTTVAHVATSRQHATCADTPAYADALARTRW